MIKCWRFLSVPVPVITGNAIAPAAAFSLWTHRRRREHNQRCWSLGGWWLRSGRCHCLSCWARWRWAPSPPRSSGRGREVLPRPLSISRDPALEVREKERCAACTCLKHHIEGLTVSRTEFEWLTKGCLGTRTPALSTDPPEGLQGSWWSLL